MIDLDLDQCWSATTVQPSLVKTPARRLKVSRRRFVQTTAAAIVGAPFVMRSSICAATPNGKLSHACIGVGGRGAGDLQNFLSHPRVQIVALCDVDANTLNGAARKVPGARLYSDWRELLEKEGDKFDSVNVTVPDHMHFRIAMTEAILLGTVAIRVPDQKLDWDAKRMEFPNHSEAERCLRRSYRHGWDVAGVKIAV